MALSVVLYSKLATDNDNYLIQIEDYYVWDVIRLNAIKLITLLIIGLIIGYID